MTHQDGRREFLKTAANTAASLTAGAFLADKAQAQRPPITPRQTAPLNQRAVLPNGKEVTRAEILQMLNLDPNTAADKWLTIVCGVNASALKPQDAVRLLEQGKIKPNMLTETQIQQIRKVKPDVIR